MGLEIIMEMTAPYSDISAMRMKDLNLICTFACVFVHASCASFFL